MNNNDAAQAYLTSTAARNLTTTTKSLPQTQETTSRWLLRMLPWVQTAGGVYRVNRRKVSSNSDVPTNKYGEALINLASEHNERNELPNTFVDYAPSPHEYELSSTQTILQIPVRIADIYNEPMDQTEQQLRLTIEAIRERQENELLHNAKFGLLHNVAPKQRMRIHPDVSPLDALDELLSRRRQTHFVLASPQAIATLGRECNRLGLAPDNVELNGHKVLGWRGIPILPCTKLLTDENNMTSILAVRTGEKCGGVIGLHQTGIPDEYQPGLSVRFMNINEQGLISYLVTAYYSVAVLLPDALGMLEGIQVAHYPE